MSPFRRNAFTTWLVVVVVVFGLGFFGLTSLVIGWFAGVEGVAGPVTDLGYGALIGIILTMGLAVQLHAPQSKIAGIQQAALVVPALLMGSAVALDSQDLVSALIVTVAVGSLLALHPARGEFLKKGGSISPTLLAITILGAIPLTAYALEMGAQAQDLKGPPHHVQRLSTMAAMAFAIVLTGLLAAAKTRGWRIPSWSTGAAATVFGLASLVFPDSPGSPGQGWGMLAVAGGLLFIAAAEWEARRTKTTQVQSAQ